VNNPKELRKVIIGTALAIIWMCIFIFIKNSIVIDWTGTLDNLTPLKTVLGLIGFVIIAAYIIFINAHHETKKLIGTVTLTIVWLSLIIFYPFKDPTNTAAGAVGFFTLLFGLAVVVLWVRFFSDEIVFDDATA
jgi:hypothetical protein